MPYRKTNCRTKGRREEKERKLNTRPIKTLKVIQGIKRLSGWRDSPHSNVAYTPARLFANTLYGWREHPFLTITYTSARQFALANSHPEPAPRSLRRRISHVQTKGGYQYAD